MIQANELRIGNYINVTHVHFKESEISTIQIDDLVRIITNIPTYDYNPIQITEEWVDKFYLNKINHNNWAFDKYTIYYDGDIFNIVIADKLIIRNIKKIKYVHELQNIYYALIGEELN